MIELRQLDIISRGQFADVFIYRGDQVIKLLRAAGSHLWREHAHRVHSDELRAYEIAWASSELRPLVPRLFGPVEIHRVSDLHDCDVSSQYLLSLGLLLERVSGSEEKATGLSQKRYPHVWRAIRSFEKAGLDVGDASVMGFENPATMRFIDFTTPGGARLLAELA